MTAKECITGRRSIRQFTDKPVSHELLADIVTTASYAPSWKNTQIARYIAVEGDMKAKLAQCTSAYAKNGSIMEKPSINDIGEMILRHGKLAVELKGEYTGIREMRKHVAWYMHGVPHAAKIRNEVNYVETYEELKSLVLRFLDIEYTLGYNF